MHGNAIGNDGADALAKGLKENSTLTSLNLSCNAIGNDGADALAKGLKGKYNADSTLVSSKLISLTRMLHCCKRIKG